MDAVVTVHPLGFSPLRLPIRRTPCKSFTCLSHPLRAFSLLSDFSTSHHALSPLSFHVPLPVRMLIFPSFPNQAADLPSCGSTGAGIDGLNAGRRKDLALQPHAAPVPAAPRRRHGPWPPRGCVRRWEDADRSVSRHCHRRACGRACSLRVSLVLGFAHREDSRSAWE